MNKTELKCGIESCKRPYRAKGYCALHYKKWRHGEYGGARYKICNHEACKKPMGTWGLCEEHYKIAQMKGEESVAEAAAPAGEKTAPPPKKDENPKS